MTTLANKVRETPDFNSITEIPEGRATADQMAVLSTRYELARKHAQGKDVLEAACGAGMGLGLLARTARRLVGGDIDKRNLAIARRNYANRPAVGIMQFDAQELPFPGASFDVVILYEALYYIPSAEAFFREARRVLRRGGTLLISTVNCRWGEFNPSPFSVRYFDACELAESLARHGFHVDIRAGFPGSTGGLLHAMIGSIRKVAVFLHLVPRTMKGKEWLKRLFYGELTPIPYELAGDVSTPAPLETLAPPYPADQYRFIYAIATLE